MLGWIIPIVIGVPLVIGAIWFVVAIEKKRSASRLFGMRLLGIELPKSEEEKLPEKEFRDISKTAELLNALSSLKAPFALETAVKNVGEDILFFISVPGSTVDFTKNQIHGLWPEANIKETEEYTIFHSENAVGAAYLKLKENSILPIRTYEESRTDTFAPILSTFSKLNEIGEGLALQIVVKPADKKVKHSVEKAMRSLKSGKKISDVLKGTEDGGILKMLTGSQKKDKEENQSIIIDDESVKILGKKIAKPLFETNVRFVSSAKAPFEAESLLDQLGNAFGQFSNPLHNEFKIVKPKNPRNIVFRYVMRKFDNSERIILNGDEVASIFHFPASTTNVSKVRWLKARESEPPTNLPDSGVLIGESVFRGEKKNIYISEDDRRRHVYVIGQTGTGKSTLLTNMGIDDIENDKGCAFIDPHGDLIETILNNIPENRAGDVILFDPADRDRPLGLNMLEYDESKPEEKTFVVNELFNILDKLYDMKTVGGPMFEQYTKNAILLLMEDAPNDPATLMEVPKVFTDAEYRKSKLLRITNPVVIDFWEKEAIKATGEHSLSNMAPYITSKFNAFISNDYMRPIIGQKKSAFSFRKSIDERKIILINLSKGRIGDINANLLGMIITGKLLMAALSRVDMPESERRDFNLFIDEFQNFTTDSVATILSEARKYRLNLTIAHQFLGQLTDRIRTAVFGNVGSTITFRVGSEDAEVLERQFAGTFTKDDLLNIDNFNAYAKILINGQTTKPFNIKTIMPKAGNGRANNVRELSKNTYGRDRREVELEILDRLRG
ncbi:MAG: hypothetical protein COU07_00495 [Candidatus Harrisonbacteria bacterium CG10_big_fil_rev_8_21_14_0_10_40_38]|uniref:DUF8128 domain-containing protein n=1 Tax=Candidatus Harrisonbacteria bacterium CG10_big_fil_rev_8_21_14_0_10_40_38 TaxID=1974583 RepID=A0A2H0UUC9_9BACT|nr:MAG: hypothetical protein COU07_00495 [Candidatus Harrisonbacteria bacterium CG10_big_fil_rev_8_21_14_0_10_40_38]